MDPNSYNYSSYGQASAAPEVERATFIRRTYAHLAGAVGAFTLLEILAFQTELPVTLMSLLGSGRGGWMIVLLVFMGVTWLAQSMADNSSSKPVQYLGLGLFVFAEVVIFSPLLFIAAKLSAPELLPSAIVITGAMFIGITAVAFITKQDFSFMRSILTVAGCIALGVIAASMIFGFNLGVLFSGAMVVFAACSILYDTSNILHKYRTDQHVAASLSLFASVMLLFWYVLRLLRR